jgi:hypothetical protein
MSEHELSKALVGRGSGDDDRLAERVIRRDRWIVRSLAGLTIVLWTLSVATIIALYWAALLWVVPIFAHFIEEGEAGSADRHAHWEPVMYFVIRIGWPAAIASAVLAVLAAICTVLLVYWSRRATLRLVDRRLEQILAELRRT